MIDLKVRILFNNYSGKQKINAPLKRIFWYFLTFGKCGERYHYQHVMMRKYFPLLDDRTTTRFRHLNRATKAAGIAFNRLNHINCRCSIKSLI